MYGGSDMDKVGQRCGDRVTGAASVRLLRPFVDCFLCHHEPEALLLRVLERRDRAGKSDSKHTAGCVTRAASAAGGGGSSPAPPLS